jgi:hypothetical protein
MLWPFYLSRKEFQYPLEGRLVKNTSLVKYKIMYNPLTSEEMFLEYESYCPREILQYL